MTILTNADLRDNLSVRIPRATPYAPTLAIKDENIDSFNALPRTGLAYDEIENRLLLYNSKDDEKIYIYYPGLISIANTPFPNDFRPVLIDKNGKRMPDLDFKKIWNVLHDIAVNHKYDIDVLSILFLRMAYMIGYEHISDDYTLETLDIKKNSRLSSSSIKFTWNKLVFPDDVIETLNDKFGAVTDNKVSFEAFLYYNDLLLQNEDCKYSQAVDKSGRRKTTSGRINTALTHLEILAYLNDGIGLSDLLSSFTNSRGIAPLSQSKFGLACGDLVSRI